MIRLSITFVSAAIACSIGALVFSKWQPQSFIMAAAGFTLALIGFVLAVVALT